MKGLLIAEKPSLMREIESAYNKSSLPFSLDFTCFRGHFMSLQEPDSYQPEWAKPWRKEALPMIPEEFKFEVKPSCKKEAASISDLIKSGKYDFVVNACDPGREGEAIFWTFYNTYKFKLPVKRIWPEDVTEEKLKEALLHLRDYSKDKEISNLREASLCRMHFDWLIGMNLSRAATLQTGEFIPIGRVQTPTLSIVVNRDLEIENFKPVDFFELESDFNDYKGTWFNSESSETSFKTEAEAKLVANKVDKKAGEIIDVKKTTNTEYAPPLYSLPELQKEANRVLGFTASRTLEIAQVLYEKHKILSYPRTDSRALSTSMAKEIPDRIKVLEGIPEVDKYVKLILSDKSRIDAVVKNKKYVDNAKVTDHHALINTGKKPNLSVLTKEEKDLYLLVVIKFLSIFLDPYVAEKTVITTEVEKEKFKTNGSVVKALGYREILNSTSTDTVLPAKKKGDKVNVKEVKILSKKTKPPVSFNDSSLIEAMQQAGKFSSSEEFKNILKKAEGIGTPATRAGIIEGLVARKFFERKGKSIISSQSGRDIIAAMDGKTVVSPDLTAIWESRLIQLEDDELSVSDFNNKMIGYIKEQVSDFFSSLATISTSRVSGEIIGKCPFCGSDVLMDNYAAKCQKYKNGCKLYISKEIAKKKLTASEIKKLLKKEATSKMKFKNKQGKAFEACLKLDEVEQTPKFIFDVKTSVAKCPKCKGDIMEDSFSYKCSNDCGISISKNICNAKISSKDCQTLLALKETGTKKFSKNGKTWEASLKFKSDFSKIDFNFVNKK